MTQSKGCDQTLRVRFLGPCFRSAQRTPRGEKRKEGVGRLAVPALPVENPTRHSAKRNNQFNGYWRRLVRFLM